MVEPLCLESSIEHIDSKIIEYNLAAENLRLRRCELLAQKQNADIDDVIEYALEIGIEPKRIIELIEAEVSKNSCREHN